MSFSLNLLEGSGEEQCKKVKEHYCSILKMCDNITLQFEGPPAALCLGGVKLNPSRLNRNPSVPVCSLLRQA